MKTGISRTITMAVASIVTLVALGLNMAGVDIAPGEIEALEKNLTNFLMLGYGLFISLSQIYQRLATKKVEKKLEDN